MAKKGQFKCPLTSVVRTKRTVRSRISYKDIERRFPRSLHNLLYSYSTLCDMTQCFENSASVPVFSVPVLIFEQQKENREIHSQQIFARIEQEARR